MKTGIIGCGNLGSALVKGILESDFKVDGKVLISNRKQTVPKILDGMDVQVMSNQELAKEADLIILCVLPNQIDHVLGEIKNKIDGSKLVVSTVTGVEIKQIHSLLEQDELQVVRAMPNTAISVKKSMTCMSFHSSVSDSNKNLISDLFKAVGEVEIIREEQMSSATALTACGIAFFLRSIRAASQGGVEISFHSEEALRMAAQTALGAAALLLENGTHPEREIDKVTSPNGCTIIGLNEMEHSGFSSSFIKGIRKSANKAGKLYED
jgi:pyrroline-5-carboxylate reductase